MNKKITLSEIRAEIAAAAAHVNPIVQQVGDNPETGFCEALAADLQCAFLEKIGFEVKKNIANINTAFSGDYQACKDSAAPVVALLTEYDALPQPLGHACGHQLIMGAGLLAIAASRNLMEKYRIPGTLRAMGCPGEEQLGGKIFMLEDGAFEQVDIALLSHPFFRNGVTRNILAVTHYNLEFFGRSSHASTAPELGINALDAMTVFMNGINAWRQQLPSTARVHGIITNGGTAPNVIPDYTSGFFYIRSADNDYQKFMESRLEDIARGAALIAGCDYKLEQRDASYSAGQPNAVLADEAEKIMAEMNMDFSCNIKEPLSTDFANVCDALAGVNIYFDVTNSEPLALHSVQFRDAAARPEALERTMDAAAVMTRLALNYLLDESLRQRVAQAVK